MYETDSQTRIGGHGESDRIHKTVNEIEQRHFRHVGNMVSSALGDISFMCFVGPDDCHAHVLLDVYCNENSGPGSKTVIFDDKQ